MAGKVTKSGLAQEMLIWVIAQVVNIVILYAVYYFNKRRALLGKKILGN